MDMTASDRLKAVRRSSHTSLDGDLSHRTLHRSCPVVFSMVLRNTSTCAVR